MSSGLSKELRGKHSVSLVSGKHLSIQSRGCEGDGRGKR